MGEEAKCVCVSSKTERNLKVEKLKKRGAAIGHDDWLDSSGMGPGGVFFQCAISQKPSHALLHANPTWTLRGR